MPYCRNSDAIWVAVTNSSWVPLPRPCMASEARNSSWARMQRSHTLVGTACLIRAGCEVRVGEVVPAWPKPDAAGKAQGKRTIERRCRTSCFFMEENPSSLQAFTFFDGFFTRG